MELSSALLLLLASLGYFCNAEERIYMDNCAKTGFTCKTNLKNRMDVTFNCGTKEDISLYLWQFRSIANINSLTITSCKTVRLSFTCTGENKPIQYLTISEVQNLIIIPSVLVHNPPEVNFLNIKNIPIIPRNTFSQIKLQTYKPGCFNPVADLENITFSNVQVGMIETEAFGNLVNMKNFTWTSTNIAHIQTNAIQLKMLPGGDVIISNSSLDMLEHLAFRMISENMKISKCKFVELQGSAINGTIENFEFLNNSVSNMESDALQILTYETRLLGNQFFYLHSGALQRISPGLLYDSQRNFANLRFVYEFQNNLINYADVGGLNPDYNAYRKVASDVVVRNNAFLCHCKKLGWLHYDDMEYQHGFENVADFYKNLLDSTNGNTCAYTTCKLPLKVVKLPACKTENFKIQDLCPVHPTVKKPIKLAAIKSNSAITNTSNYFSLLPITYMLHFLGI